MMQTQLLRRLPIHFDMETQDPDDVMTLAILACHPAVELVGVTVTPGGPDQVGLVHHVLWFLGHPKIPVGGDPSRTQPSVSAFHDKWIGKHSSVVDQTAYDVLRVTEDAVLLTGGPLRNFTHGLTRHRQWVGQGGFAGDSVVPPEHRLKKFEGLETCPTFNFNGAPTTALAMLSNPHHDRRLLVSKNVCHGVAWDRDFHARVGALQDRTPGLELVYRGMALYLAKKPEGKKLHDLLALACAIDPTVCTFARVEVYREDGKWGSRLTNEGNTHISTSVDREKFFDVLTRA